MRSTVIAAAFAAGAIAVPHQHQKRDVATEVDVVYVTDVVTVTAGSSPSSTSASSKTHYGHNWASWSYFSTSSSTAAPTAETSSTSASSKTQYGSSWASWSYFSTSSTAATTVETSSTYVAPTSTSTYVAPTTSSTPSSTSVAPSSTAASSTSSTAAVPTSYEEITVYHHNLHRSNHSAPDVAWDAGLASTAATIASSCVYAHNVDTNGGGYGQNIAAGVEANNISAIITDLFYNGEVGWYNGLYGEAQPDMTNFENWGHFSQIVWKATTKVGCATQDCTSQGLSNVGSDVAPYFTVCNYESPGNYANEYADNIGSPLDRATAQWNTGL